MEYYIRNECSCGGDVWIATNLETDERTHKKVIVVSHGVCVYCDKNMVFPNENLDVFIKNFDKNKIFTQ